MATWPLIAFHVSIFALVAAVVFGAFVLRNALIHLVVAARERSEKILQHDTARSLPSSQSVPLYMPGQTRTL